MKPHILWPALALALTGCASSSSGSDQIRISEDSAYKRTVGQHHDSVQNVRFPRPRQTVSLDSIAPATEFLSYADMQPLAIGDQLRVFDATNRSKTALPADQRVCVPTSPCAELGHFKFNTSFQPDLIHYTVTRSPVHVDEDTVLAHGQLEYRDGAEQCHGIFRVPMLAGEYEFQVQVVRVSLTNGYTIGVRYAIVNPSISLEAELARIALREAGQALIIDGLQPAIDELNRQLSLDQLAHDTIQVIEGISLVMTAAEVAALFSGNITVAMAMRTVVKEILGEVIKEIVVGVIRSEFPDPTELRVEDIVLHRVSLSCFYCNASFVAVDVRSGSHIRCLKCGTGVLLGLRVRKGDRD